MWQVTGDTWHVTHSVRWTCSQNFSPLVLPVWDWQCLEYIWTKGSIPSLSLFSRYGLASHIAFSQGFVWIKSQRLMFCGCLIRTSSNTKIPSGSNLSFLVLINGRMSHFWRTFGGKKFAPRVSVPELQNTTTKFILCYVQSMAYIDNHPCQIKNIWFNRLFFLIH